MFTFPMTMFSGGYENLLSTLFNGIDDQVVMPDTPALNIENNLTMVCWVKTTGTQDAAFMSKYKTGGNNRQYLLGQTAAGGLRALISRDGGSANAKDYNSTETINDGNWHMVALTFATNVLKLYIDGSEITPNKPSDVTVNDMPGNNVSALQLSSIEGNPLLFEFAGNMDECAIWDTVVLTSAEITALYNSGVPIKLSQNSGDYTSATNLVGWWRMGDGDNATTILDQKGVSNGTLVNMDASNYVLDVPI